MSDAVTPFTNAAELALAARREIISMTSTAKASHVASALSVVDILSVLYTGAANISPANMDSADRDIVILSKGHSASALYSVLALQGFFQRIGSHNTATTMPLSVAT